MRGRIRLYARAHAPRTNAAVGKQARALHERVDDQRLVERSARSDRTRRDVQRDVVAHDLSHSMVSASAWVGFTLPA